MSSRALLLYSIIVVVLCGCQSGPSALDEAGTMVAQTVAVAPPTNTPLPTSTPLPTETPTPKPTFTPDVNATITAEASSILSELEVLLADTDVQYQNGHLAWQQTEPVTIEMSGPQADDNIREYDPDLTGRNFILKSDVTWNASGILICGSIFRSEDDLSIGKQYQFYFYRLSGLPAYFIDVFEFGDFKNSITKSRFSEDLDVTNDSTNQFALVAQKNEFTIYINGKRQGRYFDDSTQRAAGSFGFLAWQQSGKGSCRFENSWVWILD